MFAAPATFAVDAAPAAAVAAGENALLKQRFGRVQSALALL